MPVQPPATESGWRVWGHDHAVRELQSAARRGPRHAYILSGYHHVGKSTLAREFAKSIICEQAPEGAYCGSCPACRRIDRGTHPDVSLFDLQRQQQSAEKTTTAKNLTLNIQTVREITSSVALRPMESRHRVVIVDDVETMQETAQEAFLKTLEEPPAYAILLLLTTDAELLLETIRSRAATIQLQTVHTTTIQAILDASGVDTEQASVVAFASVGRPGWALQALENSQMLQARIDRQASVLSWIRSDQYGRLAEATRLGDAFTKDRDAVYGTLLAAQTIWRELVLRASGVEVAQGPDAAIRAADTLSPGEAVRALKSVDACLSDLDANVRPRLALQSMVLQWPTI